MGVINYWNDFRALAYSDEILIGIGAVLFIIGIVRIIKSSLTMLFWLVLSGLGLTAISQGLDKSPFQVAAMQKDQVSEYLGAGKDMSSDVLAVLCRKLKESELLDANTAEN